MYGENSLVHSNSEWNRNESIYGRQRGALTRTYTIEYKTFENGIQAEIRIFASFFPLPVLSDGLMLEIFVDRIVEAGGGRGWKDDVEGRRNKKDEKEEPGDEKVSQLWLELRV